VLRVIVAISREPELEATVESHPSRNEGWGTILLHDECEARGRRGRAADGVDCDVVDSCRSGGDW